MARVVLLALLLASCRGDGDDDAGGAATVAGCPTTIACDIKLSELSHCHPPVICGFLVFSSSPGPTPTLTTFGGASCAMSSLRDGDTGLIRWTLNPGPTMEEHELRIFSERWGLESVRITSDPLTDGYVRGPERLKEPQFFADCLASSSAFSPWDCLSGWGSVCKH